MILKNVAQYLLIVISAFPSCSGFLSPLDKAQMAPKIPQNFFADFARRGWLFEKVR